jgi:hypothetical protein
MTSEHTTPAREPQFGTAVASDKARTRLTASPKAVAAVAARVPDLVEAEAERAIRRARAEVLQRCYEQRTAIRDMLLSCGATAFDREAPSPLAIGIHHEIFQLLDGAFTPQAIGDFLRHWVRRPEYLAAVARGNARRGLDGTDTGPVDYAHRVAAHNSFFPPPPPRGFAPATRATTAGAP